METIRRQLDESLIEIKHLQEINSNYTSDIKVQKRIQHKLSKEVEINVDNLKILQKDLIEEKQANVVIISQRNELQNILQAQKIETMVAINAVSKVHKGINFNNSIENALLETANASTKKQWEEAIAAMKRRDAVFQTTDIHQNEMNSQLVQMNQEMKLLKVEQNEMTKKLTSKEQECESLNRRLTSLQSNYRESMQKQEESRHALIQANHTENTFKTELNQIKKEFEVNFLSE
jgi:chromosome segregation ATPase